MAEPLILWVGDSARVGRTYEPVGEGSAETQPHQPHVLNDREYDFASRIEGVGEWQRFPDAPLSDSYAPFVWNHDDISPGRNSVVAISAEDPAVVTCSEPHGLSAGRTVEVLIEGVTGADAALVNGTWTATASGTHDFELTLDSSALTVATLSATIRQAGWSYYSASVTSGWKPLTSGTDRSLGGSIGTSDTDDRTWGAELAMLADLHDRFGEDEKRIHLLVVGHDCGLTARESVPCAGVTAGASTLVTVSESTLFEDAGRAQPVTLFGFTGDHAVLNGQQEARYVDETTIEVLVDTSGATAYAGGGRAVMRPRWHQTLGAAEAFGDLQARLGEAVGAAADAGRDLYCAGIVVGLGYREQASLADDDAETRTGLAVESISATGFPTTVTLALSHGIEANSAKHLPMVRLRNCDGLDGLHECRIVDETTVAVHVSNVEAIDVTNAVVDIGDPSWTFAEEFPGFVAALRAAVAAETGDTAANIPVILVQPKALSDCRAAWDGSTAFATCAASRRVSVAHSRLHAPRSGVSVLPTSTVRLSTGSSREWSRWSALLVGHTVATEVVRLETPTQAYGGSYGRGAPVVVIVGDDIAQGTASYLTAHYDQNENHDGTWVFGRGLNIWDFGETAFRDFAAVDLVDGSAQPGNSNSHPTWNLNPGDLEGGPGSLVGPDLTLVPEVREAFTDPIYVVKLGVAGSGLTGGSMDLRVVATASVEVEDDEDPQTDITTKVAHGRYDTESTVTVTVTGLSEVGIQDGVYTATPQSATVLRLHLSTASPGGVPASNGGMVSVPRPSWVKADGDIWPTIVAARDEAFAALRDLGYEPSTVGIFAPGLGLNDALYGEPDDYAAALEQFIADMRDEWTTRVRPNVAVPFVMGKVLSSDEYPGGTVTAALVAAVQAAQSAVLDADPAGAAVDTDTLKLNSDDFAITFESYLHLGTALAAAFLEVDQTTAACEGSGTEYTIDSAAFVS